MQPRVGNVLILGFPGTALLSHRVVPGWFFEKRSERRGRRRLCRSSWLFRMVVQDGEGDELVFDRFDEQRMRENLFWKDTHEEDGTVAREALAFPGEFPGLETPRMSAGFQRSEGALSRSQQNCNHFPTLCVVGGAGFLPL